MVKASDVWTSDDRFQEDWSLTHWTTGNAFGWSNISQHSEQSAGIKVSSIVSVLSYNLWTYVYWLQFVQCFPEWQWISKCNGRWASDRTWILHTSDSRSHHNLHVRRKERDHLHWGWQWWKNYSSFFSVPSFVSKKIQESIATYINTDQVLL